MSVDSETLALLHMVTMNFKKSDTFLQSIRLVFANSFMWHSTALMGKDVSLYTRLEKEDSLQVSIGETIKL